MERREVSLTATSSAAIRDVLTSTIAALTPARGGKYVAHPMRSNDFRSWAEQNPTSSFRRFSVREVGPLLGPEVTNCDEEWVTTTFDVVVAYPLDFRAGPQMALDRDDAMEADSLQIERAVGLVGFAALEAAAFCTVMAAPDREREQGQACAFTILRLPIGYWRETL